MPEYTITMSANSSIAAGAENRSDLGSTFSTSLNPPLISVD